MKKIIFLFTILITTTLVAYSQTSSPVDKEETRSPYESREIRKSYKRLKVSVYSYKIGNDTKDTLLNEENFYEPEDILDYVKQFEHDEINLPEIRKTYDSKGNLLTMEIEYNENDPPIEIKTFFDNDSLTSITKKYNERNLIVKKTRILTKQSKTTTKTVMYNNSNKGLSPDAFSENETITISNKHDDNNKLIETGSGKAKSNITYDKNNNMLKEAIYKKGDIIQD